MKTANRPLPAFVSLCDWAQQNSMRVELYAGDLDKQSGVERRPVVEVRVLHDGKTYRRLCDGLGELNRTAKALLTWLRKEAA